MSSGNVRRVPSLHDPIEKCHCPECTTEPDFLQAFADAAQQALRKKQMMTVVVDGQAYTGRVQMVTPTSWTVTMAVVSQVTGHKRTVVATFDPGLTSAYWVAPLEQTPSDMELAKLLDLAVEPSADAGAGALSPEDLAALGIE